MGDAADSSDMDRFIRSPEGERHLREIRRSLLAHSVVGVTFTNKTSVVGMILLLDNGDSIATVLPSLDITAIRQRFPGVLE